MAELEPDLADMEKLQSFCSAFKGMSIELVTSAVELIVEHNKDHHWLPPVSQTICTSLLECLPTNDLSNLISQESKDFCNVIGSFAKVGSRALKLKMIDILKKTFLNGNLEHSGAETKVIPLLLNTWLTCLKTKLRGAQTKLRHEIDSLFFDAGSLSAWERPNAIVADHPEVEEFYRSNQRPKSFGPFERMSEAKRYGESAVDGLQWAEFAISKTGSSFCCEITKLYPEFLDADHASSLLSMSLLVMHRLNEELVPQFSCVQEVSKFHKCFICITTLLSR